MRNKVLKAITAVAILAVMLGTCGFDSADRTVPAAMIGAGVLWLIPFFIVNRDHV